MLFLILWSGFEQIIIRVTYDGDEKTCVKDTNTCWEYFYDKGYEVTQILCDRNPRRVCVAYNESVWDRINENPYLEYAILDSLKQIDNCWEGCLKYRKW